ncbi:MAG: Rrf2 family transcriptional regulator [Elusimicrobia bacterium]|jgi:Rrf2 family protein|nr:Rrf2 family transcriptional regulator [Elusimicrobiota bacterium]
MQSLIKISDAAVIAVHAIDYMIKKNDSVYIASNLARELQVSYNHLSKILQLLVKHGYLQTMRGPSGGYVITRKGENARIKDIIALIDGDVEKNVCFMNTKICSRHSCVLKDFLQRTLDDFKKTVNTKIKDF